ncbi:branched-chain amino acid ABC transporter permease [Deinococcus metallilatus]|uniref:Branched-chain amino acid ABC transporter permease n=2 Tax=Deinococcus TaxID=1298 RepID=A0AAJ5K4D6_9DEIO|nr:branched-chain amino acid ABC transporter permease [Deinococcus metallilatus]MBB5296433.1 branched-chain amino acid transport system permease protein [Deinococcus metallilatus]QBY09897.1 branched-chain amino acid ABC transporter permease [Deinococcus metallilatus]RXJ08621.1 branched-chain amino acid ABC transporter permease [Deinococcus metallilatus]TLK25095.1 branched-chain amino acid ABC transporter permease [Deinococcus metallilatus]GMA14654.1 branched-chain amino acid ABC transporter pe
MTRPAFKPGLWGWLALFVLAALLPLLKPGGYVLDIAINTMIWAMLAYGLNVMLGYTGLLPLAHAGFFGIGAYAVGILTLKSGWSFWLAWPFAVILCALLGLLLGLVAFRTKGDVFAIFTLGVGVIIQLVINKWDALTGGNEGLNGVPPPQGFLGLDFSKAANFYYVALAALILTVLIVARTRGSVFGRSLVAIRGGEDLARSAGIDVFSHKLRAMMLSTALAGLAGGVYAAYVGFLGSSVTGPTTTFTVLLYLLVGGVGTLAGPLLGTALIYVALQFMKGLQDYQYIVFGPLLVLLVMFAPQGLAGLWDRSRLRRASARTERTVDHA